jgi:hypothetical protein
MKTGSVTCLVSNGRKSIKVSDFIVKPLEESKWPDFARLVEKHNADRGLQKKRIASIVNPDFARLVEKHNADRGLQKKRIASIALAEALSEGGGGTPALISASSVTGMQPPGFW